MEVVADAQHNQTRLSEAAPTDPATMDVAVADAQQLQNVLLTRKSKKKGQA